VLRSLITMRLPFLLAMEEAPRISSCGRGGPTDQTICWRVL
jgi:hypothetical protein